MSCETPQPPLTEVVQTTRSSHSAQFEPSSSVAIPHPARSTFSSTSQDVLRLDFLSLPSSANQQQSTIQNGSPPTSSIKCAPSNNDLAAEHGLPANLPTLPSVMPRTSPQVPSMVPQHEQGASPAPTQHNYPDPLVTFNTLSQNYLRMLATPAQEAPVTEDSIPKPSLVPAPVAQHQQTAPSATESLNIESMLSDLIKESPMLSDYMSPDDMMHPPMEEQYLTSPLFTDFDPTSPLFTHGSADFNNTSPNLTDDDFFTSPLIMDNHNGPDNGTNFTMPMYSMDVIRTPALAPDMSPFIADVSSPSIQTPSNAIGFTSSPLIVDDSTMPPPSSASSSTSSPAHRVTKPLPHRPSNRRVPTGTRRNLTADALLPVDAPTQQRKYTLPSVTSRKEVPVTFARKRAAVVGADDDEHLPDLPPDASEKEQIEWKRRQNTIAARKSRKRKLEHQQWLEDEVERLRRDKEKWKTRAVTLRGVLKGRGEECLEDWDAEGEESS